MNWHIHSWKLTGWLSWLIKISTIFMGWYAFRNFIFSDQPVTVDYPLALIFLGAIWIHYIFQLSISIRSKELLSLSGNLILLITITGFISWFLRSGPHPITAMFAFIVMTAEALHVLFYYLNEEDQPLKTSRTLSLWLIAMSLILLGMLALSVR